MIFPYNFLYVSKSNLKSTIAINVWPSSPAKDTTGVTLLDIKLVVRHAAAPRMTAGIPSGPS